MPGARLSPNVAEALALVSTRANILIERSSELETEVALAIVLPHLADPVFSWCGDTALPGDDCLTLLVADVDRLTHDQQKQLRRWLDSRPGRVQVITLSVTPLLPLVRQGAFSEELFYRLNTIRVG